MESWKKRKAYSRLQWDGIRTFLMDSVLVYFTYSCIAAIISTSGIGAIIALAIPITLFFLAFVFLNYGIGAQCVFYYKGRYYDSEVNPTFNSFFVYERKLKLAVTLFVDGIFGYMAYKTIMLAFLTPSFWPITCAILFPILILVLTCAFIYEFVRNFKEAQTLTLGPILTENNEQPHDEVTTTNPKNTNQTICFQDTKVKQFEQIGEETYLELKQGEQNLNHTTHN